MKKLEVILKKSVLAALITVIAAAAVTGCGKKEKEAVSAVRESSAETAPEENAAEESVDYGIITGVANTDTGEVWAIEDTDNGIPIITPEPAPDPMAEINARAAEKGLPNPPEIDVNSWQFILASADHTLPEGYAPEGPTKVGDTECPIDSRIADNLRSFANDCKAAGNPVYLSSGYRSYSEQKMLFDAKVEQYGEEMAATIVLPPGTSEHQTGLCSDITDVYRSPKNPAELSETATFKWLNAHCEEYGFILRYPENKQDITKVIYEPWHFRYVGETAAKYIKENDLCLEEFLALYGVE